MNSSLSTKEKILYAIDIKRYIGIEIGPLVSPLVRKEDGDVRYVDRASTEEIKNWYSKAKNLDLTKIVPIDYVWGDQSLAEATKHASYFDYCIAAHVIEHVPDLIGWLQEISTILKDGGTAAFSVPDRRYTFDYLRQPSIAADIIEAYLLKRRKPSIRHIFDHFSNFAEIDVTQAWKPDFDGSNLKPEKDLQKIFNICLDSLKNDTYIDSHCWVFTADSFLHLLAVLSQLHLIDFKINRFFDVEENNHEFVIQLEKLSSTLRQDEKHSLFLKSLEKTYPHKLVIHFTSNISGTAQVYYDTGAGFNERESICRKYLKDDPFALEFPLPPMALKALRFDPSMAPSKIQIRSIHLHPFSQDGYEIPLDGLRPGANIRSSGMKKHFFYAKSVPFTKDPYLFINLPQQLKEKL